MKRAQLQQESVVPMVVIMHCDAHVRSSALMHAQQPSLQVLLPHSMHRAAMPLLLLLLPVLPAAHFSLFAADVYAGDSALRTATHISSFCSVRILHNTAHSTQHSMQKKVRQAV
jgi:hypothetical protein